MDFSYKDGSRTYRLTAELIYEDKDVERYKVWARKNTSKYIMLQNNRPFLKSKNLKDKRFNWKVLEGEITNRSALDKVIEILEFWIDPPG